MAKELDNDSGQTLAEEVDTKMKPFSDLAEKVAIVTGGNQGIGYAIAQGLSNLGAKIIIVNRRASEGEVAAQDLRGAGGSAVSISADISQKKSVEEMAERTMERFKMIDVLINNAGVGVRKPAIEMTEEECDTLMDTNLKGLFLCCQAVGRQMIRQKRGKIVNISSMAATFALMNRSFYSGTKAGVSQLTRTLALEWARYGVYVNAIAPGIIQTPLTEGYIKSNSERSKKVLKKTPLGRFGKPEDLVGTALFLSSDLSNFITGQTLLVDGGYSLGCMDW